MLTAYLETELGYSLEVRNIFASIYFQLLKYKSNNTTNGSPTDPITLSHSTPMAGHSVSNRTKYKIMKLFYWPGMGKDITNFFQAYHRCQSTAKKAHSRALLTFTAPLISQLFNKVTINIVGPLPMTKKMNRFVLTYIDIDSRYPQAVPFRTVTAKDIATALMSIMTRLLIPKEILSDPRFKLLVLCHEGNLPIPRHLSQPYSNLNTPVKRVGREVPPNSPTDDQEDICQQA